MLAWRARGFSPALIGAIFAIALVAAGLISGSVGLYAHRFGRRRLLFAQALAMSTGGLLLALGHSPWPALLAAAGATFSPGGKDVGGMLPLEQAALAQVTHGERRTAAYARYNLLASAGGALGVLAVAALPSGGHATSVALGIYVLGGVALATLYIGLSAAVEGGGRPATRPGLGPSRGAVLRLSALFGVDALAGGLVVQGLMVLWFHQRFGVGAGTLGPLFFCANLASALSFLAAAPLARRFGLLRTMVFTHLPSNVLLLLLPFAPGLPAAAALLVARSLLSQLDVPTRQAYTMELVQPEERAAAAGVTASVRGFAGAVSPTLSGWALAAGLPALPFVLAGSLKAAYDLTLYAVFRTRPAAPGGTPRLAP